VTDPGQPPPTANPTNKFCAGVRVDSTSAYAVVESSPCDSQASSNGVHEAASAAAAATSLLAATALVVMAESVEEVTAYTARCRWRCGGCRAERPGSRGSGCVLREPPGPVVAPLLYPLCIVRAHQIKRLCVSVIFLIFLRSFTPQYLAAAQWFGRL
jgi:hypothetical protein